LFFRCTYLLISLSESKFKMRRMMKNCVWTLNDVPCHLRPVSVDFTFLISFTAISWRKNS
jgi:hypothetical protein